VAQKLSDLVVQEVSLVDVPANGEKRFLIVKRNTEPKGGEDVSVNEQRVNKTDALPDASTIEKKHEKGLLSRILYAIGKSLGWTDDQVEKAYWEASTFAEEMYNLKLCKAEGELWDYLYALYDSIWKTLRDDTVDREAIIRASLQQFVETVGNALPAWLSGDSVEKTGRKIAANRLEKLKEARRILDEIIAEAEGSANTDTSTPVEVEDSATESTDSNSNSGGGEQMTEEQVKNIVKEFLGSEEFQKDLEGAIKKALTSDEVKKSFSSVENALASEEVVKSLAESLSNTEVFKNSVQDLTKGLENTIQKIAQHVDVLERNIGVSKRLLSDVDVRKGQEDFWAGVIPFSKKKISGGE
jgi:hypothetical protein